MIHRYLATGVGVLISVLALASWLEHRRSRRLGGAAEVSPWWATATLVWVCVQGAFGALTVTMKLYPAIVTAHLLGGVALLALLAAQAQGYVRAPLRCRRADCGCHAGRARALLAADRARWLGLDELRRARLHRLPRLPGLRGGRRWTSRTASRCSASWARPAGRRLAAVRGADRDPLRPPSRSPTSCSPPSRCSRGAWRSPGGRARAAALGLDAGGRRAVAARQRAVATSSSAGPWWPRVAHTGGAAALVAWLTVLLTRARQARRGLPRRRQSRPAALGRLP